MPVNGLCVAFTLIMPPREDLSMAKLVVCPHEGPDGVVCGTEVRSDDAEEVISTVRDHAAAEHDLDLSRGDVERMMQEE